MTKANNIHTAEIDGVTVNVHGGDMPLSEMRQYVKHYSEKYKDKRVKSLDITLVSGGFADVDISFMPVKFERIRRITGYLVGTLDRFNNQWHFGYKAHIGVDKDSGLVHHIKVTSANVNDVTVMFELMHGEENEAYGDSGYIGADKREEAIVRNKQGKKIKYKINRRPSQIKKLTKSGQYHAKKAEHKKSSVRAKVEHIFAVVKRIFGYRKTRYRGLRKQTAKLNMMFALANLYLADRKSLLV